MAYEGEGPVRVYLDPFLKRLNEGATLEWAPGRQKFWLLHPELDA